MGALVTTALWPFLLLLPAVPGMVLGVLVSIGGVLYQICVRLTCLTFLLFFFEKNNGYGGGGSGSVYLHENISQVIFYTKKITKGYAK